MDEGLEDRVLDDLRHVSYILHNPASSREKMEIMHILTQAVSYSNIRSSSEEVCTIPGRQTAVFSCCAALGVKDDAVKSNGRLQEK